jgi:WD40 repeat protein
VDSLPEGGFRIWDLPSRKSIDLKNEEWHTPWTTLSPDGTSLLAGAMEDSILWWNLQAPSQAPTLIEGKRAIFSQSGDLLVTLHERSVKVWNAKSRSLKSEFPVGAELSFMTPMALSPDGNILAIGSNPLLEIDNAIRLWDTRSGNLLGFCKGHTQGVMWLAFSPDAETLASASSDSTLRIWDIRTQQELLSLQRLGDPVSDLLFSPDGNWLLGKTAKGLRLLDGSRDRDPAKATALGRN